MFDLRHALLSDGAVELFSKSVCEQDLAKGTARIVDTSSLIQLRIPATFHAQWFFAAYNRFEQEGVCEGSEIHW